MRPLLRRGSIAAVVLAAAAVQPSLAAAAPLDRPAAPVPMTVAFDVRCQDLSALADVMPGMNHAADDLSSVPSAHLELGVPADVAVAESVPYSVLVDGVERQHGALARGGVVMTDVSLPDARATQVRVVSGEHTVFDRTVVPRC